MEKEYQNYNEYRSDEECVMFYKQLQLKFDRLKQVIERKLKGKYTSAFEKLCVFRVYEVTRFLKHLSNEFSYEGISYSELPMFYEVKKTKYSHFLGTAKTYSVEIYGYYIKSKENVVFSLRSKIIEFWQEFKKMQTEEVTKLFSVNILPTFLLRQIIQIAKNKINDLDIIKLYSMRTMDWEEVIRVYRGTKYEEDYSDTLDEIDNLLTKNSLRRLPITTSDGNLRVNLSAMPLFLNIYNLNFMRKIFGGMMLQYKDFSISEYMNK